VTWLTGRLDPGTRANCSPFQKNFNNTRFIRFASKAGGLDDLLNESRAGIESNLCTLRYGDPKLGVEKAREQPSPLLCGGSDLQALGSNQAFTTRIAFKYVGKP